MAKILRKSKENHETQVLKSTFGHYSIPSVKIESKFEYKRLIMKV